MIEDRVVPAEVAAAAWRVVDEARMRYGGEPVGTRASAAAGGDGLNYSECFTRDFAVVAAASLARNDHELVRGFLTTSIALQAQERHLDCERPSPGLMPASFRIDREGERETLVADYGQRAIASVTPVDAALWWVLILRAYLRAGGDPALGRDPSTIAALERIVTLYLAPRFEMVPTLLVPEGAAMIDRRLGVYGHPLDVQALFFAALRAARELLPAEHPMQASLRMRLARLGRHVRHDYWLDADRLNTLYRYGVEQFGTGARNRFNIQPDTIPTWTMRWLRRGGGYFAGNLGPARLDFRIFTLGNLLAVNSGLASAAQSRAWFDLLDAQREDLVGVMPLKLVYPALEGEDWRRMTGADPKNAAWSYHNGGTWPYLAWPLAQAARVVGSPTWPAEAIAQGAERLDRDSWPEYYDGPLGGLIGRTARLRQGWTAAGVLAADALLRNPEAPDPFGFEPDAELEEAIHRGSSAEDEEC